MCIEPVCIEPVCMRSGDEKDRGDHEDQSEIRQDMFQDDKGCFMLSSKLGGKPTSTKTTIEGKRSWRYITLLTP